MNLIRYYSVTYSLESSEQIELEVVPGISEDDVRAEFERRFSSYPKFYIHHIKFLEEDDVTWDPH